MSKNKKLTTLAARTPDPTLETVPITIGGTEYRMCFDMGALAEAETAFNREGHAINLLEVMPTINLGNTRIMFAVAIRRFHPEVGFAPSVAMVTMANIFPIADAVADAWRKSLPEIRELETKGEAPGNPPLPVGP